MVHVSHQERDLVQEDFRFSQPVRYATPLSRIVVLSGIITFTGPRVG